jgi:hypothetical protein
VIQLKRILIIIKRQTNMDKIFITGPEYYYAILNKPRANRTWYDKLYLYYYANFSVIIILLVTGIIIIKYGWNANYLVRTHTQSGGARVTSTMGIKGIALDKATKNMEKTTGTIASAGKAVVSKDTYKKAYGGVKAGVSAGISAGEYAGEQFRENASGISNIVVFIFLGFGFMAYIFPVLAMALIGALTFLIARRTIVNTITL